MKIGVDYIGVSAGAIVFNQEQKIFLAKRGDSARDDIGKWEFPGGSVSFFENREDCAVKNFLEKYNINIKIKKTLGIYDVIDKNEKDHWVSTTFLAEYIGGEAKIIFPNKCKEIGWFKFEEILNLNLSRISSLNLKDLEKIIKL